MVCDKRVETVLRQSSATKFTIGDGVLPAGYQWCTGRRTERRFWRRYSLNKELRSTIGAGGAVWGDGSWGGNGCPGQCGRFDWVLVETGRRVGGVATEFGEWLWMRIVLRSVGAG